MTIRRIPLLLLALLAFVTGAARADTFRTINPPQPVLSGSKIEVIEFFYFKCAHCMDAEPVLTQWIKSKGDAITFRRIPIIWNANTQETAGAQMYYTFQVLGKEEELYAKAVYAVRNLHTHLDTPQEISQWIATLGVVDRTRWDSTFQSAVVVQRTQASNTIWMPYGANTAPGFVVDGKYFTDTEMGGGLLGNAYLRTLDDLLAKARADRAAKKP